MRIQLLKDWYDKDKGRVLNMDQGHALILIQQGIARLVREHETEEEIQDASKEVIEAPKDKMLRRRFSKVA